MPKITAYKCPFTKKLFETRSGYRRHLLKLRVSKVKLRASRKRQQIATQLRKEQYEKIAAVLRNVRTLPELEQAYLDCFGDMMSYAHNRKGKFRMTKFDLSDMRYSDQTSNTHACPRNGVTNWGGRTEGAPRGYPGFSGRIEYTVDEPKEFNGPFWDVSRTVSQFGVHTGTGGGCGKDENGHHQYYYDVKIFLDDFPGLKASIDELHEAHKMPLFKARLEGRRIHDPVYTSIVGNCK